MAWITDDDLAAFLDLTKDDDMADSVAASLAWCQRKRPDLDPDTDPGAAVTRAALIYAGILWREKASPEGFANDPNLGGDIPASDAMGNVYRLLGAGKPRAR